MRGFGWGLTMWGCWVTVAVAQPTAVELDVPGIACKSCAGDVQGALSALPGVARVRIDVIRRRVVIGYEPRTVTVADMLKAMDAIGFTGKRPSVAGPGRPGADRAGAASGVPVPAHRPLR
jgi:copper chaperone CopZ